jgi:DNA repair protein RecN (Recombination protein N)
MLANLTVQDIVLIDRLGVEFDAGLTVLTGETGAGKSILLDAMALALGGRGDNALVRPDAERGQVIAEFEPDADHPVRALLSENGIETDGPVILRRVQSADGKTRAFVNDQPVSAGLLRAAGASLVEIHGQHDERALVDPGEHRRLLDAFGGLEPDAAEVVRFQAAWRAAEHDAAALKGSIAEAERERDFLEAAVSELEALSPETGEEQRLADQRQMLMQAEKIAGDLGEAYETIAGSPSPVPEFSSLLRRLDRKAAEAPGLLYGVVAGLGAALDNLEEVRLGLEAALRTANFDPHELEAAEERLFALRAAARKHRTDVDGLPEVAVEISARLADLETGRERLAGLEKAVRETQARYRQAARRLSAKRETTARTLEAEVNNELPALKLETATFFVVQDVDEAAAAADGFDRIAFHVRTNPGSPAGPLMKVASGGELSRFLLALKVALADRGSAPTLVFDEIDTGAGGAVAEAIGRRLARLAERVQVLAVTHAPQVAARAGAHLLIAKSAVDKGKRVATDVTPVAGMERREEIARMLAGAVISDEARAAAARLMAPADATGTAGAAKSA